MEELERSGYHIRMEELELFDFSSLMEVLVELGQFDWWIRNLMVG
jgi:hypothetical protein